MTDKEHVITRASKGFDVFTGVVSWAGHELGVLSAAAASGLIGLSVFSYLAAGYIDRKLRGTKQ